MSLTQDEIERKSKQVLKQGQTFQRTLFKKSRDAAYRTYYKFGEKDPKKAHQNRLRTPLALAILSICLNPTLLYLIGSQISNGLAMVFLYTLCGLNIASGLLAFFGYWYGTKYHPGETIVKVGKHLSFFHGIALLILAWPIIEAFSYDLIDWLFTLIQNPVAYLTFVLIFAFLAAVILPIPVELALAGYIVYLTTPGTAFLGLGIWGSFLIISIVMGVGKALGSWIVFVIGVKVEDLVATYLSWGWFKKMMMATHRFCLRFGYLAMYLVMCIPLMTDTVPLYIFSILNKEGDVFELKWFVMSNFWAGIARTLIVGITVMGGVLSYGYVA